VHLDPKSELHQKILSTQITTRSGNGSPDTQFAYLHARAPTFDTFAITFCAAKYQAVSGEFPISKRDTIFRVGRNKLSGRFFVNIGLL